MQLDFDPLTLCAGAGCDSRVHVPRGRDELTRSDLNRDMLGLCHLRRGWDILGSRTCSDAFRAACVLFSRLVQEIVGFMDERVALGILLPEMITAPTCSVSTHHTLFRNIQ